MGFFNNSLFLIIEKNILHIPFQEIVTSTDKQITNLVNKETDKFIKTKEFKFVPPRLKASYTISDNNILSIFI